MIYEAGRIPGWGKSLLFPTLKKGTIYRTKLNTSDDNLEDNTFYEEFHSSSDRYRDIIVAPDGVTFYAITDNTGGTSSPSGTTAGSIQNPGVIVKIKYIGETNWYADDDNDGYGDINHIKIASSQPLVI